MRDVARSCIADGHLGWALALSASSAYGGMEVCASSPRFPSQQRGTGAPRAQFISAVSVVDSG